MLAVWVTCQVLKEEKEVRDGFNIKYRITKRILYLQNTSAGETRTCFG